MMDYNNYDNFQALKCFLDEIKPAGPKKWTNKGKKFLEEKINEKKIKFCVRGKDKNAVKVLLYEVTETKEICVNALLVEHKFAAGDGPK